MDDFPPTAKSRVKRLHQRAHYDRETIYRILDAGFVCHVGYGIDDHPYVTATSYWRDGDSIYWHGSSASRMLRTLKGGVPVCVNVSLIDGLVLARSGFHSSINYRSVMLFGKATALGDDQEKLRALEAFSERITPGRWDELRPPTAQELKATMVLVMPIEEAVAKERDGPPGDDEEDYTLDVWAGELPFHLTAGKPVPDPRLKPGIAEPAYLQDYELEGQPKGS
ncbi:MAG: pyridoxamine 5'-phosphate oxidase family protein [Alphaproteobacteria bacterium]|nr:pyridoxamine 5'-phosphate oxidase family protein [Alphaproteobacteria bacterium]